ncbi:uncharacterized protein LOC134676794 [Cydia fagiglandana]|uniref:uncharacterized protein LOC134676794 n=1 Tax=Cydia fagiglandana TaxID=1458189 RepID=UPI002FEE023E
MDLREIIKWFIPCFHILLKLDARMTLIWVLLFCNLCPGISASELDESSHLNNAKKVVSYENNFKLNQSEVYGSKSLVSEELRNEDTSLGRTFGRPMKKMMQALIPLAMAIGSAGTWAVVAALIGAKTLVVTLFILKLLLMAGAAKVNMTLAVELIDAGFKNRQTYNYYPGPQTPYNAYQRPMVPVPNPVVPVPKPVVPTLFGGLLGAKLHHQPAPPYAPPPSKEIHLHIHNGQQGHHEHEEEVIPNISSWSRDGPVSSPASISSKVSAEAYNPYLYLAGPQTIRTPYGNYVKVD